jgi:hypothetical protein
LGQIDTALDEKAMHVCHQLATTKAHAKIEEGNQKPLQVLIPHSNSPFSLFNVHPVYGQLEL